MIYGREYDDYADGEAEESETFEEAADRLWDEYRDDVACGLRQEAPRWPLTQRKINATEDT